MTTQNAPANTVEGRMTAGSCRVAEGGQVLSCKTRMNTPELKAFMKLQALLTINSMNYLPEEPTLYLSYLKTGTDETLGR